MKPDIANVYWTHPVQARHDLPEPMPENRRGWMLNFAMQHSRA